jgi:glycosyltransferase involved in cell wall biosynthesis
MLKNNKRPLRILQVVYKLNRGGIGNWLLSVQRHLDSSRYQMDFLAHDLSPGDNDADVLHLGSRILYCPYPSQPWRYGSNFKEILQQHGPYDVIHSHLSNCGYHVKLAAECGIPIRIAHSHSIYWKRLIGISPKAKVARLLFWPFLRFWLDRYATLGLAASPAAAASLFGSRWQEDKRWQVLPCAIDLQPFEEKVDRPSLRGELGIPTDAFVIGHVGRFTKEKNHTFIIDVVSEISRRHSNTRLLLIGEGSLKPSIEKYAFQVGLSEKIIFTGLRRDVPRLMLGAMDLFIFPSIYEGLGLVLIEAQSAGLSCLISQTIPKEAIAIPFLVKKLSLSEPVSAWAATALQIFETKNKWDRRQALQVMGKSLFNIRLNVRLLEKIYGGI